MPPELQGQRQGHQPLRCHQAGRQQHDPHGHEPGCHDLHGCRQEVELQEMAAAQQEQVLEQTG